MEKIPTLERQTLLDGGIPADIVDQLKAGPFLVFLGVLTCSLVLFFLIGLTCGFSSTVSFVCSICC